MTHRTSPIRCIIYGNSRNSPKTFVSNSMVRNSPCHLVRNVVLTTCTMETRRNCVCMHTRCPRSMTQLGRTVTILRRIKLLNSSVLKAKFSFRVRVGHNTNTFMYNRNSTLATSVRKGENVPHMGPPHAIRRKL